MYPKLLGGVMKETISNSYILIMVHIHLASSRRQVFNTQIFVHSLFLELFTFYLEVEVRCYTIRLMVMG